MHPWQPTASFEILKKRAEIIAKIRVFFASRKVLEVETPLLSHTTVTDPYLHSISVNYCKKENASQETLYLQTSPEFAMKRLLATMNYSLFQICKAFRDKESGRHHQPEFTILEWYRVGFNHHDLMDEVDSLLQFILHTSPGKCFTYAKLFQNYLNINPHTITIQNLKKHFRKHALDHLEKIAGDDKDLYLQLLMTEYIEPKLHNQGVIFIYDYPVTQAALARIRNETPPVAERFEVYVNGIELANGFHELSNAKEQRKRFQCDLEKRQQLGYKKPHIDENLLAALAHGLPDCAGVALGVDRLIMLALNKSSIEEVISFPIDIW